MSESIKKNAMLNDHHKNIATFIHLSTFSRFFIPLGNYLGPVVLWVINKEKSEFINEHGKQAINFQLSVLLYTTILGVISIPLFIFNIFRGFDFNMFDFSFFNLNSSFPFFLFGSIGLITVVGFVFEVIFVIKASLKAKEGELYKYPFTIHFIK